MGHSERLGNAGGSQPDPETGAVRSPPDTSRLSIVSDSDQFARRSDLIASLTRDRPGRTRRRRGRFPGCNP